MELAESDWGKIVFEHAQLRFLDYFQNYLFDHRNDWQALEKEHQNLMELAAQIYQSKDHENILAIREALQRYLDLQGHWPESVLLNEWAISAAKAIGDELSVARFTHDRADILHQAGEYTQAEHLYIESENAYRSLKNIEMALHSRHMRSMVKRAQGQLHEADHLCQTTIEEAQAIGLSTWLAHPFYVRGLIARDLGDYQEARNNIEKSLELLMGTNENAVIAQCYHFLGELDLKIGNVKSAHLNLEKSLQISRDEGIIRRVAATTRLIGDLARMEDKFVEAEGYYDQAIEISTNIGDRPELAKALLSKGKLYLILRNELKAITAFNTANLIYSEIGDPRGRILSLYYLFRLYGKQRRFLTAANSLICAVRLIQDAKLYNPRYLLSLIRSGVL